MKIIDKTGYLKTLPRIVKPHTVVLHHTAGGNLGGAEVTLKKLGLGYHYMIDKDGQVYKYGDPSRRMSHSYKRNTGTVGVSYVGGRTHKDAATPRQITSIKKLLRMIKELHPTVTKVTGHKHIDPRTKHPADPYKIDPTWQGDSLGGYITGRNWDNDFMYMEEIARDTGLEFYSALFPNRKNKKGY